MLTQHIALVPEVPGVNTAEMARVSAALQLQVFRDFAPSWGVSATVGVFPHLESVPVDHWPVIIAARSVGAEEGIHVDTEGQPFALVEMSPGWSVAASHVCLEMLTNPLGNRTVTGPSPKPDQGPVRLLIEACGPCESAEFAYLIEDVLVSDFSMPSYWEAAGAQSDQYSFTGVMRKRQQVLNGGHLCWHDSTSGCWWMRRRFDDSDVDTRLGQVGRRSRTVRELIAKHMGGLPSARLSLDAFEARTGEVRYRNQRACQMRAHQLRTALLPAGPRTPLLEGGLGGTDGTARRVVAPSPELGDDTINRVIDRISLKGEGGKRLDLLGALLRATLTTSPSGDSESAMGTSAAESGSHDRRPYGVTTSTMTVGVISAPAAPKSGRTVGADASPSPSDAPLSAEEPTQIRSEDLIGEPDSPDVETEKESAKSTKTKGQRTLPPPLPRPLPPPPPPNPPSRASRARSSSEGDILRDETRRGLPGPYSSQAPVAHSVAPSSASPSGANSRLTFAGFVVACIALGVTGITFVSRGVSDGGNATVAAVSGASSSRGSDAHRVPPSSADPAPHGMALAAASSALAGAARPASSCTADPAGARATESRSTVSRSVDSAPNSEQSAVVVPRHSAAPRPFRSAPHAAGPATSAESEGAEPAPRPAPASTASAPDSDPIESLIVKRK